MEFACVSTYKSGEYEASFLGNGAHYGKHGNTGVLELSLTHPVKIWWNEISNGIKFTCVVDDKVSFLMTER